MKSVSAIVTISILSVLFLYEVFGSVPALISVTNTGTITIPARLLVPQFGLRIADMMVDIVRPNFDDNAYATMWQSALNDLKAASPNGEINYVQLRIFWKVDPNTRSTWEFPTLGSNDYTQQTVMNNWQRWLFGIGDPSLAYGPSAAERIHNAGFRLEICLSTCWNPAGTLADSIPSVFGWDGREANAPQYPFDGELFLKNYMDNNLRPVAQFLANNSNFKSGDIFMLGFEMGYPTSDFTWTHNPTWTAMIDEVRQIFINAGKTIVLTVDHSSWYDDFGLGYEAVKLQNPNATITKATPGISGASYLGDLDFISISFWNPILKSTQIPATWSDADIPWVTDAWRNDQNFFKVGTGHDGVPGQYGRDFIADFGALSAVLQGKKILMNTGYSNTHSILSRSGGSFDNQAQRVAWASQIRAIRDQNWSAGQDFERYTKNKYQSSDIDDSWRNAPAQQAIIDEIRAASPP